MVNKIICINPLRADHDFVVLIMFYEPIKSVIGNEQI